MKTIILASASPRRKELLRQIGLKFKIVPSDYQEETNFKLKPHQLVKFLSLKKAEAVAEKHKKGIIVAADTIVVFKNKIIGKPRTKAEAKRILSQMSGKSHLVVSGFTILDRTRKRTVSRAVKSKVWFKKLTNREIKAYIKSGEPLDKAGAYGVQELGSVFVRKIEGDYFNVVGLPICALIESLKKFGVRIL